MAYWGLARAASGDRAKDFAREALKRKDRVSPHEQLYVDALAAQMLPDALKDKDGAPDPQEMSRQYKKALETICVNYPDDIEAGALLALATIGRDRYAIELIIREARMPVLLNRRFFAHRAVLHSENGSCRDNQRRLHL